MDHMDINIRRVSTRTQKRDFITVPWKLHEADPNWVPPLRHTIKTMLDTKKHPFYQRAELAMWVAYRNNKPIGRIAGFLNHQHNEHHKERVVFWGFFEAENCPELATALFNSVEDWARENNANAVRGPVNLSLNYECGMQISSYETKPFIMMTQNPAYYPELVESRGYSKAMDLYAWKVNNKVMKLHTRLNLIKEKLNDDPDIVIRPINMRDYYNEMSQFMVIFNDAWEKNWGFVPMSANEVHYMAKELKSILKPELAFFVTVKGETAACSLCLPNINQALQGIRNGKLFPTGLLKLLWFLKNPKPTMEGRIALLGVKQKFRHLQLGPLMYARNNELVAEHKMTDIECSWILETNRPMNFGLKKMGAHHYKTYRLYEKSL